MSFINRFTVDDNGKMIRDVHLNESQRAVLDGILFAVVHQSTGLRASDGMDL